MCAILDANVVGEVFQGDQERAGGKFLDWVINGRGHLVAGGELLAELRKGLASFKQWERELMRSGKLRVVRANQVDGRAGELRSENRCVSDDTHIIALAQVSGARLLYSNDKDLHQDFTYPILIKKPRGKVYSTVTSKDYLESHRQLLNRRDLCQIRH